MLNKITNRILLGYSFPLLFLILLSAIVYSSTAKAFKLQDEGKQTEQTIKSVNTATDGINRMIGSIRGYQIFPTDQNYINTYNEGRDRFLEGSRSLQSITDPQLRGLTAELTQLGEAYDQSSQTVIQLVNDRKFDQARAELAKPRIRDVVERRDRLIGVLQTQLDANNQSLRDTQQFLLNLIVLGTVLVILAALAAALWISLPLRRQLPQVVDSAEAIANGDLSQSLKPSKDTTEVGQLLRAFQNMTKNLNSLITQAQRSGIQIGTSATQIAAAGRQLEATVNEQVASTNEVNATARQIAMTAGDLSRSMDEVAATAVTTTESASESQTNLDKIQEAMQNLGQATSSICMKLRVMDEKANSINNVVTTITKVADQTNLLSLNAAIEAEKAGEYGAGFSVVAREIRRLADQSAVATLEIEQLVKEMQTSVSSGVMEVDKFRRDVNRYVEEVGKVSGEIEEFIAAVQNLAPRFGRVSEQMSEQYRGAEQISVAIAQLSEASQQTVQSLQETNSALGQLDDAAQGLQREIAQFKV